MLVPPPNCAVINTSTGSWACSLKSTTEVSNNTSFTDTAGSAAKMLAQMAAYITLENIEPDWSTHKITCHGKWFCTRE